MDANRLRRLAAEVDAEHRAAMEGLLAEANPAFGRRRMMRQLGGVAAAVTGAAAVVPALASAAGAQQATSTVPAVPQQATTLVATTAPVATTAAPTSTTKPPAVPQSSDLIFLAFAQSFELAAVQAYTLALAGSSVSKNTADVLLTFQNHHRQHAQAVAGIAGKAATGIPNQALLTVYSPLFQAATTENQVLQATFRLETAAASTYLSGLAQLIGTNGAGLVASILPIEARHAEVFGESLGQNFDDFVPAFETTANALSIDQYPIAQR